MSTADSYESTGKKKADRIRRQLSVFLICLGISVFLWFLVRLSREYQITLKYKLEFRGMPSGMLLTGYSDSTLDLSLRIRGFEYFSEEYFRPKNRILEINLKSIRIRQADEKLKGYILSRNLSKYISEQITYPFEILASSPDTIFFHFERKNPKRSAGKTRTIEIRPERDKKDTIKAIRGKEETNKIRI